MPDEYGLSTRREWVAALEQWIMPTQQRRETDKATVTIAASLRTNAFFLRQAARSGNVRKLMEEAETVARHLHLLADQINNPKEPAPCNDVTSCEG